MKEKSSKLISFLLFHTGIFILQQNKTIFLFLRKYVLVINVYEKERKKKPFAKTKTEKGNLLKCIPFTLLTSTLGCCDLKSSCNNSLPHFFPIFPFFPFFFCFFVFSVLNFLSSCCFFHFCFVFIIFVGST